MTSWVFTKPFFRFVDSPYHQPLYLYSNEKFHHQPQTFHSKYSHGITRACHAWRQGYGAPPACKNIPRRLDWYGLVWEKRFVPPDPGCSRGSRCPVRRRQKHAGRGSGTCKQTTEVRQDPASVRGLSENAIRKSIGHCTD